MAPIVCGYIDPVTKETCGYVPPSGTKQGLAMHMTRTHGTNLSTDPKIVRDRERKAARRAAEKTREIPVSINGSGPSVSNKQKQKALDDLVLMVQLMYPNGISTKDSSEVASFLAWCGDTTEGLLKRGVK